MKKLFKGALLATALFGMVACGPQAPAQPEEEKCTEHEDGYVGWWITGDSALAVDGVKAKENKGNTWGFGGDSFELKEITLAKAKEIDSEVGAALEAKGAVVKKIYSIDKVSVGLERLGWSQTFKDAEGKLMIANASYCLKVLKLQYDGEDDTWSTKDNLWTPNPHNAHVENLKNYWSSTWQETPDEEGFHWDMNPVVTSGAGIYTVIFAEYTTSPSLTEYNFGTAFIKTEAREGIAYEPVPETKVYSLIGDGIGGAVWSADVDLTESDGVYSVTHEFEANKEWKIRLNHAWDGGDIDVSALDVENSTTKVTNGDGNTNFKFTEAGTYKVELSFTGATPKVVITEVK